MSAAPTGADETDRMGIIHHHQRVKLVSQIANALQIGDHAIHRKDAVGSDKDMTRIGRARLFQPRTQLRHIVIGVAVTARLAKANAVNDGGVIQRIGNDRILRPQQRFKQAAIGVEAGRIENGVFHAEKIGQALLQLFMDILRAADKTHRSHAETVAIHALLRRQHQRRMVGQSQVVIGAEVDHVLARADADIGLLRRGDDTFLFKQAFLLRHCQLFIDLTIKICRHFYSPLPS